MSIPERLPRTLLFADSKGTAVKLSNYRGRVVLLDKESGLSVVGVSVDDDGWKSVKPFLEAKQVNYPVVIGDRDLARRFGITALPVTRLIDRNGKVADLHVGMVDKDAFDREIKILLKDSAARGPAK